MLKFLLFLFLYKNIILVKYSNQDIIPKEIIHEEPQNEYWIKGNFYEYYIDITNYDINEQNVFEIYGLNQDIDTDNINIYLLLTNITDIQLIKNNTIKPDLYNDRYYINSDNIQRETISQMNYFFLIFKKTEISQNFLIILIECIYKLEVYFYVGRRIPMISIEQKYQNEIELYTEKIEVRNDIRLYYKLNIDKIDKINNNIYFFLENNNIEEKNFEVIFFKNFSIVEPYKSNLLILEKNTINIKEIYFGIIGNEDDSILINLTIRIDNNKFYLIDKETREDIKLYIEDIKCDKDIFIIENYKNLNKIKTFLILEKLYGNFTLKYHNSFEDLNFENLNPKNAIETTNNIIELNGLNNIYILKCNIPSAFHFEIFYDLYQPLELDIGGSIKTLIHPNYGQTAKCINLIIEKSLLYNYEICKYYKYKAHVSVLAGNITNNTIFETVYYSQGKDHYIYNENDYTELIFCDNFDKYYPHIAFWTTDYLFIEYYFSSNILYSNMAEGRATFNSYYPNSALKIQRDVSFDYISFEAKCSQYIIGYYEIKLINDKDIESGSNIVFVGLPKIKMPEDNIINLNFSNPYNKFESILNEEDLRNNFYLLLSFKIARTTIKINTNIEYINNNQKVPLSQTKSEIIKPETEYEIKSNKTNYKINNKILFNINKCGNSANYSLINYYQDKNNIIKETPILNTHEIITIDNIYSQSKMQLLKLSEKKESNKEEQIYPAIYYNEGDILLNYFYTNDHIINNLIFNTDFSISYEEKKWSDITLSWKQYIYKEENSQKINIATNYSIYILPKYSVVKTMCQLFLIPANKSLVNSTKVDIHLNEGEYKISIIANVINEEIPFNIKYETIELNIIKKFDIALMLILSTIGLIVILLVLYLIFRKKINFFIKRKRSSSEIDKSSIDNDDTDTDNDNEEEEKQKNTKKQKLTEELIKMISKK